jgi:hypothetical protein
MASFATSRKPRATSSGVGGYFVGQVSELLTRGGEVEGLVGVGTEDGGEGGEDEAAEVEVGVCDG